MNEPAIQTLEPAAKLAVEQASRRMGHGWKDAAVALSLANLCFIAAWFAMLSDTDHGYYNKTRVTSTTLLALTFSILSTALVLWLLARWVRRSQSGFLKATAQIGLCALLLVPLNFLRHNYFGMAGPATVALAKSPWMIAAIVILGAGVWRWRRLAVRMAVAAVVILFPLSLLTFGKVTPLLIHARSLDQHATGSAPPPPALAPGPQPHIVWILFDELDQRLAFSERPQGVELPELDRIRRDSLDATNAFPPAGATQISLPALISGRSLSDAVPSSSSELSLALAGTEEAAGWSTLPTVFSQARALGVNTGLVGWYHPYDRLLGASLNYCSWYPYPPFEPSRAATFSATVINSFWSILTPVQHRRLHVKTYEHTLEDSLRIVTNSQLGLVLLQLPVPHGPGIYLPASGRFSSTIFDTAQGYWNNLALADRTMGQLRRAMEATGNWEQTWLLVSSDHWWRDAGLHDGKVDHRVPFILKPPGAPCPLTYQPAFDTVLTSELLLAILRQEITAPQQLPSWLDQHRSDPPLHYKKTRKDG